MDLTKYILICFLQAMVLLLVGCYNKREPIAPNKVFAVDSISSENVSYANYVRPLLTKNCSTCHSSKGSAPMWWLNDNTYHNAAQFANPIVKTILNETMPPAPKFPFSERDKQLLQAWLERGMPEN